CADRRMSGAEHGDDLSGVAGAVTAEHIRHAVSDPLRGFALADRRQSIGAGRIRRGPRTGSVDDGVGAQRLRTLAVLVANLERRGFAAFGPGLVKAGA